MKTIDVSCTACGALPGQKCIDIGYGDQRKTSAGHHPVRVRRAHYATLGERASRNAAKKASEQ